MARKARKKSQCQSGIYHIMLRGIDGRNIFLDEQDKTVFIQKLLKIKGTVEFKLYGYCLMDNYVHVLIKESEEIVTTLKRITVAYVQWHNRPFFSKQIFK